MSRQNVEPFDLLLSSGMTLEELLTSQQNLTKYGTTYNPHKRKK